MLSVCISRCPTPICIQWPKYHASPTYCWCISADLLTLQHSEPENITNREYFEEERVVSANYQAHAVLGASTVCGGGACPCVKRV